MEENRLRALRFCSIIAATVLASCNGGPQGASADAMKRAITVPYPFSTPGPDTTTSKPAGNIGGIGGPNETDHMGAALLKTGYAVPLYTKRMYQFPTGDGHAINIALSAKGRNAGWRCGVQVEEDSTVCRVPIGTMIIGTPTISDNSGEKYATFKCTPDPNEVGKLLVLRRYAMTFDNSNFTHNDGEFGQQNRVFTFGKSYTCVAPVDANGQLEDTP